MTNKEQIIYIKVVTPSRLLPKDVLEEVTQNIGSKFDRGTKGVLMGLNSEERRLILPNIIKLDPSDSVHWIKGVTDFYTDLTIKVPMEGGLKLNIATEKIDHTEVNGNKTLIDYPVAPLDYIKYKQCLVDDSVANEENDKNEGTYSYYIEDNIENERRESQNTKNAIRIDKIYGNLVELSDDNETFKNKKGIEFICLILGRNPRSYTIDELVNYLKELKDEAIQQISFGVDIEDTLFVKTVKDKQIKEKAFILECIEIGLLKRDGDYIVDGDDITKVYGESLSQAVKFIKSEANQEKYISLKRRYDSLNK